MSKIAKKYFRLSSSFFFEMYQYKCNANTFLHVYFMVVGQVIEKKELLNK